MTEQQREPRGISRRTIAKGAAWTVPALPIIAATPAYAESGGPPSVIPGLAYKWPGNSCNGENGVPPDLDLDGEKAYLFQFRIVNNTGKTIYLYDVGIVTDTTITFDVVAVSPPYGSPLASGSTTDLLVWANSNSSGNLTFNGTATVYWGHSYPAPDPDDHDPVVEDFYIAATPTLQAAGFGKCEIPPFEAAPDVAV